MAIRKGVITYSFLYDDGIYSDDEVQNMPVCVIIEECETGSMIGNFDAMEVTTLESEQVKPELLEMGNDGTFFD